MSYLSTLKARMESQKTLACAGIDPNPDRYPEEIKASGQSVTDQTRNFLRTYISLTAEHVCAFKAQKAYFDVLPNGHALLKEMITLAQDEYKVPVIVDAKIGDIGQTMEAYRKNIFGDLNAAGVVLNPYMGDDVLEAFSKDADRILVVLARTSNAGGACVQDQMLEKGVPLWKHVLDLCLNRWNGNNNIVPVISAHTGVDLSDIRAVSGEDTVFLYAGVGAQGADLLPIKSLLNGKGAGVFVNSSRGLLYPVSKKGESWEQAIARTVQEFKASLTQE